MLGIVYETQGVEVLTRYEELYKDWRGTSKEGTLARNGGAISESSEARMKLTRREELTRGRELTRREMLTRREQLTSSRIATHKDAEANKEGWTPSQGGRC